MSIKLKLLKGEIFLDKYDKDIKRSEIDKISNSLSLFDKLDQNGDQVLSVKEMKIAEENLNIAVSMNRTLKNAFWNNVNDTKIKKVKSEMNKITPQNVHAVLAGFQVVTDFPNSTLSEWNSRAGRPARIEKLTLPQAIINNKQIDDNCKKECLHKILDAVAESSKENEKLDEYLRN